MWMWPNSERRHTARMMETRNHPTTVHVRLFHALLQAARQYSYQTQHRSNIPSLSIPACLCTASHVPIAEMTKEAHIPVSA